MPEQFVIHPWFALVGVAFWAFVAVVVAASLWYASSRNKQKQITIRLAIEKGVPLDRDTLDSLDRSIPLRPEDYLIAGYICLAAGPGLFIFGFFMKMVAVEAFYPLLGVGIMVVLIGISMLLVSKTISRRQMKHHSGNPGM